MTQTFSPRSHKLSVLDWLVQSGVVVDVLDEPFDYTKLVADKMRALDEQTERILAGEPSDKNSTHGSASASNSGIPSSRRSAASPLGAPSAPLVDYKELTFDTLEAMNNALQTWKGAGLCKTASRAVLGSGTINQPRLAIIADFPDDSEDRDGKAFSSTTYALFRKAAHFAGFSENDVYYSYLSKWRPPARRSLAGHEIDFCRHVLMQELGFVRPHAVLLLGESCLKAFEADLDSRSVKEYVGKSYTKQVFNKDVTLYASHRGEFLVKNPSMKKVLWSGLLELADATRAKD